MLRHGQFGEFVGYFVFSYSDADMLLTLRTVDEDDDKLP